MDDRANLHEYETLLAVVKPTRAALFSHMLRHGALTLVIGGAIAFVIWMLLFAIQVPLHPFWMLAALPFILVFAWWQSGAHWSHASFRVTTERILLEYKKSVMVRPVVPPSTTLPKNTHPRMYSLVTIKWSQYQESSIPSSGFLDAVFRSKPIAIRYGSADGQLTALFPSLPFAKDLKHFLDKVDSAVRHNQMESVKPFVLKPRGMRDEI